VDRNDQKVLLHYFSEQMKKVQKSNTQKCWIYNGPNGKEIYRLNKHGRIIKDQPERSQQNLQKEINKSIEPLEFPSNNQKSNQLEDQRADDETVFSVTNLEFSSNPIETDDNEIVLIPLFLGRIEGRNQIWS
jgi:uncharacterized protein YjcR